MFLSYVSRRGDWRVYQWRCAATPHSPNTYRFGRYRVRPSCYWVATGKLSSTGPRSSASSRRRSRFLSGYYTCLQLHVAGWRSVSTGLCTIAIAYSMGQIIKSVCVCLSVCLCVRLWALSRWHFLIDFYQNRHRRKNPKTKNEFVRGSISHHPFPMQYSRYLWPNRPNFRVPRKSRSKNTIMTSYLRAKVAIWPFRARVMHPAIIIGTILQCWRIL